MAITCHTCTGRYMNNRVKYEKRNWKKGTADTNHGNRNTCTSLVAPTFQSREDHITSITQRCCVRQCKWMYDPDYEGNNYARYGCPERRLCRKHYSQLKRVDFQFEAAELEEKEYGCQHCSAHFEYEEDLINHETLFH